MGTATPSGEPGAPIDLVSGEHRQTNKEIIEPMLAVDETVCDWLGWLYWMMLGAVAALATILPEPSVSRKKACCF